MFRSTTLLLVLAFMLTACNTGPFRKKPTNSNQSYNSAGASGSSPILADKPRFDDVPIPPKSDENMERTYVYQSSTLEIGRLVYTSKKSVNEISQYYIDTCPNYGWNLENMMQAEGVQLSFTKQGKKLFVTVRPSGLTKGKTLFIVNLIPAESAIEGSQLRSGNTSAFTR